MEEKKEFQSKEKGIEDQGNNNKLKTGLKEINDLYDQYILYNE